MKKLFIIDGTSGIWKSDLVKYITDFHLNSNIQKKYSTRSKRSYEKRVGIKSDLVLVTEAEFRRLNLEFSYPYNKSQYGFSNAELLESIEKNDNTFVIIRNQQLIEKINKEIEGVKVVNVFIYTDFTRVGERLPAEINTTLKNSITKAYQDYLRKPQLYHEVLVNGSTENDFFRLIDILVTKYSVKEDNQEFKNKVEKIQNQVKVFCNKLAEDKARQFLGIISFICLGVWGGFIYITNKYEWDLIEPKLAIAALPVIGYAITIIYFLIMKKEIVLNPKTLYENVKKDFNDRFLREFEMNQKEN